MTAILQVTFAGPYVSFQDAGRPGNLRYGIPNSGPMDALSHAAANVALGNDPGATAIEVSAGGLSLACLQGELTVAVTGGDFTESWRARTLRVGDTLRVNARTAGSWAYLAVRGDLNASQWLASAATHSRSGFGGGTITTGQQIQVENEQTVPEREGEIPAPAFEDEPTTFRVVLGPQDQHFSADALASLITTPYTLTPAYDRMGVRLSGELLPLRGALSIPSEPIVRGSIQVAGDQVPTVLLADHQTTGGYPKIATIISADIDRFCQLRPGDQARFQAVEPAEAIAITRARHTEVTAYLEQTAKPGRTLAHRLMHENLISTYRDS